MSYSNINYISYLIESTILEFELLIEEQCGGFVISGFRCNILKADLTRENQYFISITDNNGSHCVDWMPFKDHLCLRVEYWKSILIKGHREVIEYSIPKIFPVRRIDLVPKPNGKGINNAE